MSMTKKQAITKIQPLTEEIEAIKKDFDKVTHKASINALEELINHKEEILEMYKKHAYS